MGPTEGKSSPFLYPWSPHSDLEWADNLIVQSIILWFKDLIPGMLQ